jgi:hypothetical protein
MKLRNLNGAIRKADGRSVRISIQTEHGIIVAGMSKSELVAGFAALGLDPLSETGLTVVDGALISEDGATVVGFGSTVAQAAVNTPGTSLLDDAPAAAKPSGPATSLLDEGPPAAPAKVDLLALD